MKQDGVLFAILSKNAWETTQSDEKASPSREPKSNANIIAVRISLTLYLTLVLHLITSFKVSNQCQAPASCIRLFWNPDTATGCILAAHLRIVAHDPHPHFLQSPEGLNKWTVGCFSWAYFKGSFFLNPASFPGS